MKRGWWAWTPAGEVGPFATLAELVAYFQSRDRTWSCDGRIVPPVRQ